MNLEQLMKAGDFQADIDRMLERATGGSTSQKNSVKRLLRRKPTSFALLMTYTLLA